MKSFIRHFIRDLYLTSIGSVVKPRAGIHILSSHFVSRKFPEFEKYCDFLEYFRKNCSMIRFEDSVEMIRQKRKTNDCLVSFTFDDGFEECYSVIAPALEEFKVNGCFFVCGNYINSDEIYMDNYNSKVVKVSNKKPMSWSQIQDLNSRGHIIGSHTLDHINMNTRDIEMVEFQLARNKQLIEKYTSGICDNFAVPFGQLKYINNETLSIAEKYHKFIFSTANYRSYFSFNGRMINRRHVEGDWPKEYLNYFLSANKKYKSDSDENID